MTSSRLELAVGGAWKRKWFRGITYLLVSGAVAGGAVLWTVRQPFFDAWLIGKLDGLVRDQTGLALQAGQIEFHPFQERVVLRDLSIGVDLLKADRLDVQVDLLSLIGHTKHIRNIELENPVSILDARRLARIHLKPRPEHGAAPQVRLDRLQVLGGDLRIQEPAWNLPRARFAYRIYGQGLGPNRLYADVRVPRIRLGEGTDAVDGSLVAMANLSDLALEVKESELRLGGNRVSAQGHYAFDARMVSADVKGRVDLAESLRLLDPKAPRTWEGTAGFKAGVRGRLADPAWNLFIDGKNLGSRSSRISPGDVRLEAHGRLDQATIQSLEWRSAQGRLQASGEWRRGVGSHLQFHGEELGLTPLATFVRVGFLDSLSVDLDGEADLPGNPWVPPQLDALGVKAEGRFLRAQENVGRLSVDLADGWLSVPDISLEIPEAYVEGSGAFRLGKRSLLSISAKASAETDASLVADILENWNIGEGWDRQGRAIRLGMSGRAIADAELEWDAPGGVRMKGQVEVETPRWHGAILDQLRADVSIQDDELRIENIAGGKGAGRAGGSLWLTWRDVPAGQDQIDMNYQAFGLPIQEGLRAADVGDLPISGQASGSVRIHGPYRRLRLDASATVQDASVYGLRIPSGSGSMAYDIAGGRLVVKDARIAESAEQLGSGNEGPTGLLALQGAMDMNLEDETWQVRLKGNLDSPSLGLPGPRFQALVDGRLEGPWLKDYGVVQLPMGSFTFSRGRLFMGQQSLEGFEGKVETGPGSLRGTLAMAGKTAPLLTVEARPQGEGLAGTLDLHVAPDSADTANLAARATKDLLLDAGLDLRLDGAWNPSGLRWSGSLENGIGHFEGFDLVQSSPAVVKGDASGGYLDLALHGQAAGRAPAAAPPGEPAHLRVSGQVPFSSRSPLDLKLEGVAELANLKSILDHVLQVDEYSLLADLKPRGDAKFDLRLSGPFADPSVDGLLSLKAGKLEIRTYPQSVEDLSFNLHFKGRDLVLLESDPLQGRFAQGAMRAWGVATWDFGGLTQYDLQTRLEDFRFRDLPEGFELDGTLTAALRGTQEKGGLLSGTLLARRMLYQADLNLRDLILASVMGLPPSLMRADPNDPLTRIDLDLDLVLAQPWEFDTNLLKLQGRPVGTFKVQGTLAEPGFKGKMDILPGGRLTNLLPAGDVVLERGTLDWVNSNDWYPTVDLQGQVDVPPYLVNLAIRGNMDGLEMKQTSTPSLRQDEITAILIDPSMASEVGAMSTGSTRTAISSGLASTGSGLLTTLALANFQESLRRTLRLDRVSVVWRTGSGGSSPETSITVGKNIDLFGHPTPLILTHQRSGTTTTTSGQVEWRFGNFVLELGVSQSGANGVAPSGEIRHTWSPGW